MSKPIRILIVEDLASDFELAQLEIRKSLEDCIFERVETRPGFLQALETFQPDVILSDYSLPRFDGMTALKLAKAQAPLTPFIIWTGSMSEDMAVKCMKAGANNYILKENLKRLGPAIVQSIAERQLLLERRQGEENLRKSEARFVTIFENSPVAIGISRLSDGKIIHINPAFENFYGYAREEVLGHTTTELDIWANPIERQNFINRMQNEKHVRGFEAISRLRSGVERTVLVSGELVDIDGEPCLMVHILDITERKLAEEKLRESEARYHGIFESAQDAIFLESLDGAILDVNQRACQIYGYTREEFLTKKVSDLVPSQEYIIWFNDEYGTHGKTTETVNVRSNGERFPVEISGGTYEFDGRKSLLIVLRDITARKQAEEALRNSEERYRGLAENFPNGTVTIYDKDLRITFVAGLELRSSGKSKTEYIGRHFNEVAPAQTWVIAKPHLQAAFEGQVRTYETAYFGDKHYFVSVAPIHNATGSIDEILLISQDITDRMRAEEKYQDIFEHSQEGIFQSTPEGRFIKVNPAMARIYGYDSPQDMFESITNIAAQLYVDPENRDEFTLLLQLHDHVESFEMINRRKDGSILWTQTSARVVRDTNGTILYYEGFLKDITERKQAEQKVHESEERFRALIENSLDNISLLAADGTLLWENPAVNRTLGYESGEFINQNIFELMHPDDMGWTQKMFATVSQESGGQQRGTFRLRHQDGVWRWIEATATNMLDDPSVKAIVINYRDVTERKLAEIEVQQQNDDLQLINSINEAVNHSKSLGEIMDLLGKELKRIFSSTGTTLYMLSPDGKSLTMQQVVISPETSRRIEKMIGSTIPLIHIPVQEGGFFQRVLNSQRGFITSDRDEIQKWMAEFIDTPFLPSAARKMIHKRIPQIFDLIHIKSTIVIPLNVNGKTLGILDVSSAGLFTEDDLRRIENISGQLIAAIQHQHANEQVHRSEEFLQSIQNALSSSMAILNEEGAIIQVNSAWRKFGEQNGLLHPEYCIGMNYLNVCDSATGPNAEEASLTARAIREVIAGKKHEVQIEYPCHSPEERRWFLLHVTRFDDGEHIWVVLAHENITERKQFENALQISEARYRLISENSTDVIWTLDLATQRFTYVSPSVVRLRGLTPQEVMAEPLQAALTPDSYQFIVTNLPARIQSFMNGDKSALSYVTEIEQTRKDGSIVPTEVVTTILTDANGMPVEILGVTRDITERKQSEKILKETSEQFHTLFEASPEGIILIDPRDNWPITDCNEAACTMNGYIRDELIGQSIDILTLLPGDSKGRMEYMERIRNEGILRYDDFHRRKDGSIFPIATSTSLITLGGQEMILGIDRDITERKQAESAEREQRALAEALRDTAEILNSTLDYGEVLDHILTAAGRVVPHSAACIMLIENGVAHVARARGYDERGFHAEVMEMELSVTEAGNLREMSETRQPLVVSETSTYPGWKIMHHTEWLHSNVGAPIAIHGEVVGFILLDGETPGFFTPVHAERLKAFASQAALAIQNARLLKQAQEEIVERRRAETQVKELLTFNEKILDNSPVGILAYKRTGECIFANSTAATIVGTTVEALRSQNYHKLDSWKQSGLYDLAGNAMAGNESLISDVRIVSTYGRESWLTAHCVKFRSNEEDNLLLLVTDITERKQAEKTLGEEREKAQKYLDIAGVMMLALDRDGSVSLINQKGCEILGYSSDEIIGMNWVDHFTPESMRVQLQETFQKLINGDSESPSDYENPVLTKNGEQRMIAWHNTLVRDENGTIITSLSSGEDITERLRAEQELRASEERFRQLAENIQEVFWMTDAVTGEEIYISPAAEKIWGHSLEDLMTNSNAFIESIYPEDLPAVQQTLAVQRAGQPTSIEYRTLRTDGSLCWVWDRAFPIFDEAGNLVRLAGIAADITERKQADEALRKNEQRLRIALASTNIAVFNQDKDLHYTWMYQPQLGYTSDQVVGKTDMELMELLSAQDVLNIMEIKRRVMETGKPERTEITIHSNNRITYYDMIVEPLLDSNGTVTGLTGSTLDITDHKNSEMEIRRHIAELEALYENGLAVGRLLNPHEIGGRIIDTFARYLSWHHVAIRLLQPESDTLELIAYNLPVLSDNEKTDAEQRLRSMISKVGQGLSGWVVQTGEPFRTGNVQAQSQYVDTQAGIQSGLYMPLKIGDRVLGVISVESEKPDAFTAQDERLLATLATQASIAFENARLYQAAQLEISERKRAEKELRESQERYQLLVETSPDGIGMMDLQGNILFGNHQMAELFHYDDPAELIGTNLISLIAPESHTEVLGYLGNKMPEGIVQEGQWLARKDGTRFFGEIRSSALQNEMGEQYAIIGQVRDVTEREQSRLALHEERQRFSDLFENSPVATWLEDFSQVISWMDGLRTQGVTDLKEYLDQNPQQYRHCVSLITILNVNQAAIMMNGARNKEELIQKVHGLMMEETPSPVMINEFELIWRGYTSFGFEMSSRKLDGSIITGIQRIYIPANNNKPDYARVIVTNTDITERIEFEKRLSASEIHYRELADSITDIFFELDQDLHYSHWNKASETLTGFTAENAIGKSMSDVFGTSKEQDRIEQIYRDVLKKHKPRIFETTFFVNKQPRNFEITAYPSTRGVAVVAKDVTERKLSESLMQKRFELMEYSNEHNLGDLMQKALDEISAWTQSTIGFFQFISEDQVTPSLQVWSTDTFQNFHSSQAEIMHKPADQAGVWAEAILQRRAVIHNDYASLPGKKGLPEGHAPLVRELVLPIIRNEKIVAVIGIGNKSQNYGQDDLELTERFADYAWDIIERKQMVMEIAEERNQLAKRVEERTSDLSRANSNLARALRVKDEFLANMSHELRTPLNAILGLSESLAEQTAGPLNEKQQRYLNTISESGHHLLTLINDILDLAKIEAGQITLDINKVDVNSVSQASLRMIKQLAQKKNLNVSVDVDEKVGLMWADERRLKQMMVNLLSNAVKFTPEGGKIGMKIEGSQDDNKVMITVWDTGIGIKEIDFERLFRPFVQLDSGLSRESSGTGLGLALVAQMARLHGGSVNVQSEAGKGSRFTIILPWEPALAPDAVERMKITGKFLAIRPGQIQKTILLIEDTQEVVMMIKDYLEMAGYKVVTAQDGLDGIVQAKFSHPDLILMDVQMPRMDGLEATKKLRQDPEFQFTPIVALTALAMPSDREHCLAAGMDEYISKPVNLRGLVKLIQSYLTLQEEKTQPK